MIDLNRLNPDDKRPGFGVDVLISGATAVGASASEQPARFDLKANGRYLSADRELQFDEMTVSSPLGRMAGALKVRFGNQSPEISFGAQLPHMEVTGVKQLWPFWMARKPRDWVMDNMFGGTITNGTIAVFIPAGRMQGPGVPMELDKNELQIGFDLANARINLPGDVPLARYRRALRSEGRGDAGRCRSRFLLLPIGPVRRRRRWSVLDPIDLCQAADG